ncbi:MAG: YihY/virulence factor BrkB family protein [Bacteroidales bacterium]|nr:YihY/virulence factor BrkB family protein [Bacteroidales bacterium]
MSLKTKAIDTVSRLIEKSKKISFPGFQKMPIYEVGVFFIKSLRGGFITTRAASIAFHMFLAIFPGIIFLFTLIPYFPVDNMEQEIMGVLSGIMPDYAFLTFKETIGDLLTNQRGGLLSISVLTTLYFSINGVNNLIATFNSSALITEKRSWWKQRLVSLTLTIILSLLIALATTLIIGSRSAVNYLVDLGVVKENWVLYLLFAGKWILVILLFYFSISVLYFAAPSKRKKWKFFSVGSSVATLSSILFSLGFSNYVNHFGKYNKFYGSLGAIIVLLLWIYFLAIVLLIGFELNSSVQSAALKNDNQLPDKT